MALGFSTVVFFLGFSTAEYINGGNEAYFFQDHLTPYSEVEDGSRRIPREVSDCQHVKWDNRTFEELLVPRPSEVSSVKAQFELHQFADTVGSGEGLLNKRYLIGSIAYVEQPYYTFSVLEPGHQGGCEVQYWSATRSTVRDTASHRYGGCRLAINAGYFNVRNGRCLGNIVSDGRIVQTSNDEQNSNFGIRQDGTLTVGYIPDEEILNSTNPFRQLVAGVIWLVRNSTNFVNESMELECSSHEDTGRMETFVNVISARTALGHDAQGRIVVAQVNGQTHKRGANLHEFADLLVRHGVVNAINLDGGGSSTFVQDHIVINYPSDHCHGTPEYRCERRVSTIVCIHDVQCLDPQCNGHGSCDVGMCSCDSPWIGEGCERVNCSLTDCFDHGNCSDGVCHCAAGWTGELCNQTCPPGRYGNNCKLTCYCYGRSKCNHITGSCICPPGYHGYGCWQECQAGYFGQDCKYKCDCSEHGSCSAVSGSCLCEAGWEGPTCNTTTVPTPTSGFSDSENSTDSGLITPDNGAVTDSITPGNGDVTHSTTPDSILSTEDKEPSIDCDDSLKTLSVAMVIVTGISSVVAHLLVCWYCQRRYYTSHLTMSHHRTRQPASRRKRRRLRKKPAFMQIPLQSSSDCSI